jgi:hypothetical protein
MAADLGTEFGKRRHIGEGIHGVQCSAVQRNAAEFNEGIKGVQCSAVQCNAAEFTEGIKGVQ